LKPLLRYAVSVSATNAAGAGPAVQLTAVPMVPTVITLTPGASTGAVGAARQVVARVVRSDTGAPGAAMAVTVRVAPRLGATPTVYTARTDATGRVAIKLSPTVNTDVSVARSAMSSWTAATGSAAVTVRPTLTATLNITSVRVGGSATLAGTTHTSLAGQSVQRQGYYSGAWHLWATTTVAANGSYRFTIKPTKKATNVYRILMPATVGHGAAASPSVTLKAS
jgi:hypothetical protein